MSRLSVTVLLLAPWPTLGSGLRTHQDGAHTALSLDGASPFWTTTANVLNARLVTIPGSRTVLALWEERRDDGDVSPFYAISFGGEPITTTRQTTYTIGIRAISGDPLSHLVELPVTLRAGENTELYVVQLVCPPIEALRDGIAELGATIHRYIPSHAYVVEMDHVIRARVAALPYVRWIGPYHPAYRLVLQRHIGSSLAVS
jgi:hypothetical protein